MFRGLRERLHRISIGVRLSVLLVVTLACVLGVVGVTSIWLQQRQMKESVQRDTRRLAESLESSLRTQMLEGDGRTGDAIRRLTRRGGVESARLINHRGTVRYASDERQVGRRLRRDAPGCVRCHPGGGRASTAAASRRVVVIDRPGREISTAIVPVFNARRCSAAPCHAHRADQQVLGVLTLDVPYRRTARSIRSFRNRLLGLSVAVVVLLAAGVLLLLRRWVTRPVASLVAGTRTVAEGDLDHSIPAAEGELGALAHAFNRMQQRLKASQQRLVVQEMLASMGKLAAGVAHEINNPLTGVLSFAEDLYEECDPDDPRREDYEVILKETMRCREIVKSLLDFGRRTGARMRKLSLAKVVDRPVRLVRKHPDLVNVELTVDVDASLPPLRGDEGRLQQVILNLLLNGAQAMPDGGQLTVTARHDPDEGALRLAITDTGTGISPEDLEHIFEVFFSTKDDKGSGIGLAVSKTIVEQHGGRLEVSSEVGRGSAFTLVLPAHA